MKISKILTALNEIKSIDLFIEKLQPVLKQINQETNALLTSLWINNIETGQIFANMIVYATKDEQPIEINQIPFSILNQYNLEFLKNNIVILRNEHELTSFCELFNNVLVLIPILDSFNIVGFFLLSFKNCINNNDLNDYLLFIKLVIAPIIIKYFSHKNQDEISYEEAYLQFHNIWQNVECGITLIDAETRKIIDINPVAVRMFGDLKENIIGRKCHKFLCPADECSCPILDKNQVVDRSERRFITCDGTSLPIIKSVTKILYKGRLTLLESFTNISSLKEAEESKRNLEVAKRANQAKSEFLSHMSHEIRSPMNAIIGMTLVGKNSDLNTKKDYCFTQIDKASKHLLGVINDILDFSKIEAAKLELSEVDFSLNVLIDRIHTLVDQKINEKNQNFIIAVDRNIPDYLFGDDQKISQVITNFLTNAIKFTPNEGTIKLIIACDVTCGAKIDLSFQVIDTGIGIPRDKIETLFSSYEQVSKNTQREYGGTGLGLPISKAIAKLMGGDVFVESELNIGSTFTLKIQLPISTKNIIKEPEEELNIKAKFAQKSILLVDDALINQEIIVSLLEPTAVNITLANNGFEACEIFSKNQNYDLILMDIQMPIMDGYEATKNIKAINQTVPIIALTANVFKEDIEKCLACGMSDHINKPIDFNDFIKKMQKYLN